MEYTGDRPVHQMRHIGQRLQRDFRAIERAPSGGATRLQLLRTPLFALGFGLVGIFTAAGFVENVLDCS